MTISSTTRTAGPFSGNNVTTTFAFAFKVFQASDLELVQVTPAGVESILVITTDYTVTLNADQNSAPGGSITLTSALATGYTLIITSDIAPLQTTDLTNQGGFYPQVITNALDKLTILVQQALGRIGRSLNYPISDTNTNATLPTKTARLGTVLAFDATTGDPTVGPTIADVGTVSGSVADIHTVADDIANVNTVAADIADVNAVAANIANVNAVAANETNIDAVAANAANINAVAADATDIGAVAGSINEVDVVAADLGGVRFTNDLGLITEPVTGPSTTAPGAITTVAISIADVQTTATNIANVNAVAGSVANVNTVAGSIANVNAVAGNNANITSVAGNATNINAVAANSTNINTVATNAAAVNTVSTNIAAVTNTSTNMAAVIDAPAQAAAAAASAAAAAASAASGMYSAVVDKSANYTVVVGDAGDLVRMTTTSGALTVTLPLISTVPDGFNVTVVKWTGDSNAVTVQRSGGDTINGANTYVLDAQYKAATFVADLQSNTWFASGSGSAGSNIVVDAFTGNGSTTAFTLSGDPGSENNTLANIAGVLQLKSAYTLAGAVVTFTSAPPNGASIEIQWSQPLAIGVPSDGSISTSKLASVLDLGALP